ncbi:hypothetical protein YSA_10798 [Pseudomonas putida ND6]|uniref:Uncharacterized protein n=1 Tax=Pseudomonas putida ND6 TaxID=231023 RepID=I3V4F2_PSEPU|nr:hypothetical protein YSA_10798 [Pseudomonas putida ND6]
MRYRNASFKMFSRISFLFSSDHSSSAMLTEESFNLGVFEYLKQVFTGQN